jgi:hypothetical protein
LSGNQLAELSALPESENFSLVYQVHRANFPKGSVKIKFVESCQQAFRNQQNMQSSTEHNEASTSEFVLDLPINLPMMDGNEIGF